MAKWQFPFPSKAASGSNALTVGVDIDDYFFRLSRNVAF
jgi:hypothetical protein